MIERQTIDGREATIAYFDMDFNPVEKDTPDSYIKILFDDGEMVLLRDTAPEAESDPVPDETDEEHEHDGEAWDKHRHRTGKRKTLKIHGHELAHWARNIAAQDAERIHSAISVGLTSGEDNTDIAHRVIGSRRVNGANGATEITRQHIFRLGRGLLHKRKSRMRGA